MTEWAEALVAALTGETISLSDPPEPDLPESDPSESDPSESDPSESDPSESDPSESDPSESDLPESDLPNQVDRDSLLARLAERGWTAERLRLEAETTWSRGQPWPHPIPAAAARFGAARWQAALNDLRHRLDLDVTRQAPSRRQQLNADERRLMQDKPPHY